MQLHQILQKSTPKVKTKKHVQKQSSGGTLWKKNILKKFSQNSRKNTCVGVYHLIKLEPETCCCIKIETQTRVFFYEFWDISEVFQIKVNICSAFFFTLICFVGVLKICTAKKNLFTQTEKLEHILLVLPKKRNQM